MKKCILLVNGNTTELTTIRLLLEKLNLDCTITSANSGREALNQMMGSTPFHLTGKLRPDILLLDHKLPDMSGEDFLGIMRKYYSLERVPIFLLSDSGKIVDNHFEKFNIAGCIHGPFEDDADSLEKFKLICSELGSKTSFLFPFIASTSKRIGRAKTSFFQNGLTAGIKITACISGALLIGGAAIYQFKKQPEQMPVYSQTILHVDSVKNDTAPVADLPAQKDSSEPNSGKVKSFTIKLPLIAKSDSVLLNPATKNQPSNSSRKQKKYQIKIVPKTNTR